MDTELFRIAIRNVLYRKTRSFLTLLGVAIGIAAVVALISLGQGLSATVTDQLGQLGSNTITVMPSFGGSGSFGPPGMFGKSLKEDDVELVEKVRGVRRAIPMQTKQLMVEYDDESTITWVSAFPPEEGVEMFEDLQGFDLESGRWMKNNEKGSVVVGNNVPEIIFPDMRLRNKVTIEGKRFRVVGILESVGNRQDDSSFMMSMEAMKSITNDSEEIYAIMVEATDNTEEVAEEIEEELDDKYGEDVFSAMTTEQIIESVNAVFAALSAVLAGIAAISLVVAGFGIMNTMLMSVMERTREIGIMKAVGATNFRILSLFLAESAIVGIAGGILGMILGAVTTIGLSGIISSTIGFDFQSSLSPFLMAGVVVFSAVVGSISGLYPAWRAAKLDPAEALRYE